MLNDSIDDLVKRFFERYSGARQHFMLARLHLKTGIDLRAVLAKSDPPLDAGRANLVRKTLGEMCPDLNS